MVEDAINKLYEQCHLTDLKFEYQDVEQFVFSMDFGHITVNKNTKEIYSTVSGFMGILEVR